MTDVKPASPPADFDGRRARFRQYESSEAITAYLQRLEREWPERSDIVAHIAQQIKALPVEVPKVLELCCGPGRLAQTLLATLPTMTYVGVDLSPPFLAYARAQVAGKENQAQLLELDLSKPAWGQELGSQLYRGSPSLQPIESGHFHAIVSMQSLHDVGDDAAIARIYQQAKAFLRPGGFFLNADLIVPEGEDLPNNPGRRSIPRHLALLTAAGYNRPRCTLALGQFGVVIGSKQNHDSKEKS